MRQLMPSQRKRSRLIPGQIEEDDDGVLNRGGSKEKAVGVGYAGYRESGRIVFSLPLFCSLQKV